jgi:hypothetical protein
MLSKTRLGGLKNSKQGEPNAENLHPMATNPNRRGLPKV